MVQRLRRHRSAYTARPAGAALLMRTVRAGMTTRAFQLGGRMMLMVVLCRDHPGFVLDAHQRNLGRRIERIVLGFAEG